MPRRIVGWVTASWDEIGIVQSMNRSMGMSAGLALGLVACTGSGPHVMLDFSRPHFFSAPFPSDDLFANGAADEYAFPNPTGAPVVEQARSLLVGNHGFALTGAVFFQISEGLDASSLPSLAATAAAGSPVVLAAIDPSAPDYGKRYPVEVTFEPTGTAYGADNLLALLPLQGMPMRPNERYAAVVTTALRNAHGTRLDASASDVLARFPDARAALPMLGISEDSVAGITAFTTGDPAAELAIARQTALVQPAPTLYDAFQLTDIYDDYCAFKTTIAMPDWQSGSPPYGTEGGTWILDASGAPIYQRSEEADFVLTVPRNPQPAGGWPLVVFSRTGGGGDRPLVDRGQEATNGGPSIIPGEGPALYLARAGFAAIEVDGPLGGLRNTTDANEDFTTFNVVNLGAMRDNIRESAIELDVIAKYGVAMHVDASACPATGSDVTFDASHVAIMGHSMGAWIIPIAAADEPMFGAMVLSGAGGSWIDNIIYKQLPTAPLPIIEDLLRVSALKPDDPILSFAAWSLEPADPQVYGAHIVREPPAGAPPREVLMIQGIVDDYILPRIAEATSLSFGLDLAGVELDTESDPRLIGELTLGPLLPLNGRSMIAEPARSNVMVGSSVATAVVTQHMSDGIEDGHEVMFQTDPPKHEYQCFLNSWLTTGAPSVPTDASRDAPCPAL
jgi:hypothetical protein